MCVVGVDGEELFVITDEQRLLLLLFDDETLLLQLFIDCCCCLLSFDLFQFGFVAETEVEECGGLIDMRM